MGGSSEGILGNIGGTTCTLLPSIHSSLPLAQQPVGMTNQQHEENNENSLLNPLYPTKD